MTLKQCLRKGKKYWLGPIVAVHAIGEYAFIEYQEKHFCPHPKRGQPTCRNCFSIFLNENCTSHSATSLDEALALGIAIKHLGCNSQAGHLFMKMLAVEQPSKEAI